jgi:hypothetical protein
MSGMNDYHLPPELWRLIFRLVTAVDGLLDTSPLPPLSHALRSYKYYPDKWYNYEMPDKLALVLVCRLWRELAVDFLYELVWIQQPEQLFALLAAIELCPTLGSNHAAIYPRARAVKALWLSVSEFKSEEAMYRGIRKVFNLCTDLRILRLQLPTEYDAETDSACIRQQSASLRHLQIDMEWIEDFPTFFLPLLEHLQQYGMLEVLHIYWSEYCEGFHSQPISFPRLHTMMLHIEESLPILNNFSEWDLPALQSLSLYFASEINDDDNPHDLETFLRSHGRNLQTLVFESGPMQQPLALIGACCPSLHDFRSTLST